MPTRLKRAASSSSIDRYFANNDSGARLARSNTIQSARDIPDVIIIDAEEELEADVDEIHVSFVSRDLGISDRHETLDSHRFTTEDGITIDVKPGSTVELKDGSFLRVVLILRRSGKTCLRGILMKLYREIDVKIGRSNNYQGRELYSLLPQQEECGLCAVLQIKAGDPDPGVDSTLVEKSVTEVSRLRHVTFTNSWGYGHTYRMNHEQQSNLFRFDRDDALACRWKWVEVVQNTNGEVKAREWRLLHLSQQDCDLGAGVSRCSLFRLFRPAIETIDISEDDDADVSYQGSRTIVPSETKRDPQGRNSIKHFFKPLDRAPDLSAGNRSAKRDCRITKSLPSDKRHQCKHTYADVCAGCGGTALGARIAGLSIKYLLDNNPNACESLRLNFHPECVLEKDLRVFIQEFLDGKLGTGSKWWVDVLHLSFPCPAFSIANPGSNPERDEMHTALVYSLHDLVKIFQPRIITLEQVTGIMATNKGDGQHLRMQIHVLTDLGYQVKWGTLNFAEYGLVHARKRIIITAACPGQVLPPWPRPTHGQGLKPWVTIGDVLRSIPNDHRDTAIMRSSILRSVPPYNPHRPLRSCVMTNGTNQNHPNGRRSFTPREHAMLQQFPVDYQFCGSSSTQVLTQIGNAVPSGVAAMLFKAVLKALQETDDEFAAERR